MVLSSHFLQRTKRDRKARKKIAKCPRARGRTKRPRNPRYLHQEIYQMYSHLKRRMLALTVGLFILTAHAQEKPNPDSQVSTVLLRTDHSWDGVKYDSYPSG